MRPPRARLDDSAFLWPNSFDVRSAIVPQSANAPWMEFAGMVESGDSNSSKHIDDIVCGDVR
jgi:hypothetical protein